MTRRKSGVIVPHSPRWYQRLAAWCVVASLRAIALTLRFKIIDESGYFTKPNPGPAIYCLWHNRLALCVEVYERYVKPRNKTTGLAALVSASKDGAFLTAILEGFNLQAVRGSSSRRGPQALLELTGCAQNGFDLAITPDGPRGPRYVIQEGVMSLAQLTGLPIIAGSSYLNWKIQLKSWDRFQIPLPFARCDVKLLKPVLVPRDCSDADREQIRQNLEQALRSITRD